MVANLSIVEFWLVLDSGGEICCAFDRLGLFQNYGPAIIIAR
jgi:hypothetical protein